MKKTYLNQILTIMAFIVSTPLSHKIGKTPVGSNQYSPSMTEPILDNPVEEVTIENFTAKRNNYIVSHGNDVSHYQGKIDYEKYKEASNFMICKLGENFKEDSHFYTNINGAIKNNINFGIYIYSHANNTLEAQKEANYVIEILDKYSLKGKLSYPIYFDYEEASIRQRTKKENTEIINTFCETLTSNHYYPGLYIGGSNYLNYTEYEDISCDIWIAQYYKGSAKEKLTQFFNKYTSSRVTMWQFDDGSYNSDSISGINVGASSKYIDQNYSFVDYPSIIK